MKALLLIAAVAGALSGCSMSSHDLGRNTDRSVSQTMGNNDMSREWGRGAYEGKGGAQSWAGGDDTSAGLGWRHD